MSNQNVSPRPNPNGSAGHTANAAVQASTPIPNNHSTPDPSMDASQTIASDAAPAGTKITPFHPTVFTIHYPEGVFPMRPRDLVHAMDHITVDNMVYKQFWAIIEQETGRTSEKNSLMADVPNECGYPGDMLAIDSGRVWRAALQGCHNAGYNEVHFYVLPEEKRGEKSGTAWPYILGVACLMLTYLIWYVLKQNVSPV